MPPGWGAGAWGGAPWGGGDLLTVTRAEAIGENAVRVRFNLPVLLQNIGDFADGLTPANYAVARLTFGARDVAIAQIEHDGASLDSVVMRLDRSLSGAPALYDARVSRVRGAAGEVLDPAAAFFSFLGCERFVPPDLERTAPDRFRDIANPQALGDRLGITDAQLGTIPIDGAGDYALDAGLTNVRKRIYRRLVTQPGGFYHLPDYGLGLLDRVKRLAGPVQLAALQRDAQAQLAQEPGVRSVSVAVSLDGAIVRFKIKVRTDIGEDAFEFPFSTEAT